MIVSVSKLIEIGYGVIYMDCSKRSKGGGCAQDIDEISNFLGHCSSCHPFVIRAVEVRLEWWHSCLSELEKA